MSEARSRSPLHSFNENLGARFVDFGGWEMPVQYRVGACRAPGSQDHRSLVRRIPPRPIPMAGRRGVDRPQPAVDQRRDVDRARTDPIHALPQRRRWDRRRPAHLAVGGGLLLGVAQRLHPHSNDGEVRGSLSKGRDRGSEDRNGDGGCARPRGAPRRWNKPSASSRSASGPTGCLQARPRSIWPGPGTRGSGAEKSWPIPTRPSTSSKSSGGSA